MQRKYPIKITRQYYLWKRQTTGVYYAVRCNCGRQEKRSLGVKTKIEAEVQLGLLNEEMILEERGFLTANQKKDAEAPTIRELVEPYKEYSKEIHKDSWHSVICYHINCYFSHVLDYRITEIEVGDIEDWHSWIKRKRKVTNATANRVLEVLGGMLKFVSNRRRRFGISRNWNPPRIPYKKESRPDIRILSADEIGRIFENAEKVEMREHLTGKLVLSSEQVSLFVRIGILAGLRKQEILNLRPCDIDWERSVIIVQPHGSEMENGKRGEKVFDTKTSRSRRVPIHRDLKPWLGKIVGNYYFPGDDGLPRKDIRRAWDKVIELSGVNPKPTIHDMRHAFCTLNAPFVEAPILMSWAGHTQMSTTQGYINRARVGDSPESLDKYAIGAKPRKNAAAQ